MRKLKQTSLAVVIMLALSTGAMAGIIECPPAPTPEPPPAVMGITETPPSEQSVIELSDPVADLALSLLQNMLTLF